MSGYRTLMERGVCDGKLVTSVDMVLSTVIALALHRLTNLMSVV